MIECAPDADWRRRYLMSLSRLAAILASAAWFVPSGGNPSTGDPRIKPVAELAGDYNLGDGLGINCALTI
jgi:hypothetical protein